MIALFPVLFAITGILCLPAFISLRRKKFIHIPDYLICISPFLFWILLCAFGIGAQSLSNIIELFYIGCLSVILFYSYTFGFTRFKQPTLTSSWIFAILTLVPVLCFRLFMPNIPE